MKVNPDDRGEVLLYRTEDGRAALDVRLAGETVWLTQAQIAELFGTKRPAITKHLGNIFKSGELSVRAVCSVLEHTAADGKRYKTQYYNLDAIISVGYRVNSASATRFRIWATQTLKDHLIRGYTLNERRLRETGLTRKSCRGFRSRQAVGGIGMRRRKSRGERAEVCAT